MVKIWDSRPVVKSQDEDYHMENSHMVAIGQMVASAGKSLLGGL